jgi:ATP-dependent Lon protease
MRQRVRDELCKMDREYEPISMRSKFPDNFQLTHQKKRYIDPETVREVDLPKKMEEVEEVNEDAETFLLSEEAEVVDELAQAIEKTIEINHGDTGYSYLNLFGPYVEGANSVTLIDPYIRKEYQIKNLLAFIEVLASTGSIEALHLITSAEDAYEERAIREKLREIKAQIKKYNIEFTYKFDKDIHDREVIIDDDWHIYPLRGLDIYDAPESYYSLGVIDQKKRKCRATKIIYQKKT